MPIGPIPSSAKLPNVVVSVDKDGTVSGTTSPGARVEIANLSTAPTGHLMPHDVAEVVVAGADGRFSIAMASTVGGDVLQVQVKSDEAAAPSSTIQLRVDAADRANDPRAAFVSVKRLRVDLGDDGNVIVSARTNLPLSEPAALVRFTNTRTKASVDVVVDPLGRISPTAIEAVVGDTIDVAVSDDAATRAPVSIGDLAVASRKVAAPLAASRDAPYAKLVDVPGRLFLDQPERLGKLGTVGLGKQGGLGDCPVPAGASAIAAVDPNGIADLIRDCGDGTFAVTFHPVDEEPREIIVDGKLFTRGGTSPIYGSGVERGNEIELWFPLVEKAYAELKGGYEVLQQGTSVGKVLSDLTGRNNTEVWLNAVSDVDALWTRMLRARANGQAMACGTYPSSESARYRGSGLHANHAYSLLGLEEKDGERLVTMRNPWGGGAGFSGVFQLKLADFASLYQVLNVC